MRSKSSSDLQNRSIDALKRETLQLLEPELQLAEPSRTLKHFINETFERFLKAPLQEDFPTTTQLATFAQDSSDTPVTRQPDDALVEVLDKESRAFYELENAMLEKKLDDGFESVDEFISFSLSIQNRRKARRGISLEKHLAYIFESNEVTFEEQVHTEHSTVDFLFPSGSAYQSFKESKSPLVIMLAAKSSCKDRWRQVLNEAQALDKRHLFTLEAAISSQQTNEMGESNLSLVVPEENKQSFPKPGTEILNLERFLRRVKSRTN
jgi:hypothetical protein